MEPKPRQREEYRPGIGYEINLWDCAERGDVSLVNELLDRRGVHVDVRGAWHRTALHWAAVAGHADVADTLCAHGASVDARDDSKWTALHWASNNGHTKVVRVLLRYGADVNRLTEDGRTPLELCRKPKTRLILQTFEKTNVPRVLVIGGGMAGIACTVDLHQRGYRVSLLEAKEHIGGRCRTGRFEGASVELGASWIHGTEGNPLHVLATQMKVPIIKTYGSRAYFDAETGKEFELSKVAHVLRDFDAALAKITHNQKDYVSTGDVPLSEALLNSGHYHEKYSAEKNNSLEARMWSFLVASVEQIESASAQQLSAQFYDTDDEFAGADASLAEGYTAFVERLAKSIEKYIYCCQIVSRIERKDGEVVVVTQKGRFHADAVVITVPLGVLKAENAIAFDPPLPPQKREAISKVGFGLVEKLAFLFERPFWGDSVEVLGVVNKTKGAFRWWWSCQQVTVRPVLICFIAADFARSVADLTEPELVERALDVLRKIFKKKFIEPKAWKFSRWGHDPYTRGSYSYHGVNAGGPELRNILAESVSNSLYFAGEHTNPRHPATVHGAYESGLREAKKISSDHPIEKDEGRFIPHDVQEIVEIRNKLEK